MFSREPEPVEILCDAPSYAIVRACQKLGFRAPEDVRWCHTRHVPAEAVEPSGRATVPAWKVLLGISEPDPQQCVCRSELPLLERYSFTLRSGGVVNYYLAQCARCCTIYWREG